YPASAEEKLGFDVVRDRLASYVRSSLGETRLRGMRPSRDLGWLRAELERVAELQEAFRFDDPVPLDDVLDVRDVLRRAAPEDSYVGPDDLRAVLLVAATVRRLKEYVESRREKYPRLVQSVLRITPLPEMERYIAHIVDDDGQMRDDASPELHRLRRLILRRQARLRDTLQSELRKAIGQGHATEEQPTIRNGRMVIPVRAEARRKVQGFVQDTSASGQTVYIEPAACLDLNNEVRELEGEERREVERILRAATAQLRHHAEALHDNLRVLAGFDLLQAKAHFSNRIDAVVPHLNDEGVIQIRAGRNPVLQLHFQHLAEQEGEASRTVVPLDLALGEAYTTLVITGPNAGGKTVAMKTVGLLALMLAYGLPVPVDPASSLSLFDRLFVDIGDEQSIEEDLSTFSSHVANLRRMLQQADARTLILIDEAGTGTDPEEGGALAQAVLERLTQAGARTIATTHHGSLKVFAHQTGGVENGSMEFDQETLSPTYRFRAQVPGSSYAFEIAHRIGLERRVLDRARELVGEPKTTLEDLITTFEARNQALAARLAEAEQTLEQASRDKAEYAQRIGRVRAERDTIRQEALDEAERIVREANARIERTIREIKEAQAEKEATRAARARLDQFKETVEKRRGVVEKRRRGRPGRSSKTGREQRRAEEAATTSGTLRVGDQVVLDAGATAAEVLELDGEDAVITIGAMRMRVKRDRLTKVGGARKQQVTVRQVRQDPSDLVAVRARTRVDLRGYRVDEALPEVVRLIDEAVATNLHRVEILHGKGSGALRQAIHEYLASSPAVAHFDEAPWNQGGAGVTCVTLR
ncbi:MAG: endonuclease MutS2, partial [Rhodothermales bacterium]